MTEGNAEISLRGPLFSTLGHTFVVQFLEEATLLVGTRANSTVHQMMDQSFKHPTPYYETQVAMRSTMHEVIIGDRGIIYGPWLEGTGSRNATTRFKGYSHWRRATQQTREQVRTIIGPALARCIARLGGW